MAKKKVAKSRVTREQAPRFLGRIVQSTLDPLTAASGVNGPHEVWFPSSKADVATAVALTQKQRVFIRSGTQRAAATDVVDAAGGMVINLAELRKVDINDGVVNAEAAATTGTMANGLAEHGLALPLGDNPQQSVASNVLDDGPSCLMRTLGPLSNYVSSLNVVTPAGQPLTLSDVSPVAQARAGNAVITEVTFKPASAKNLWMLRKSFPYPGQDHFLALAKALFLNKKIAPRSDLVLDAFSARYDIPVVRITAAGSEADDETALKELVDKALAGLPPEYASEVITENYSGSDVIKSTVDPGFVIPRDPQIDTHRVHQIVEPNADLNEFLGRVTEDIHRGLAFRDDQTGKLDKDFRLFMRLQLNREDRLELSGLVYTAGLVASSFPSRLASLAPVARAETPLSLALGPFPAAEPRIPGFKGAVYLPSDEGFSSYATQYATSSFPPAEMTPHMVAYPLDEADIKAAIAFAKTQNKRIVAHSGGHQYCGKSSGGDESIVLSMDAFNQFRPISQNSFDVGPAVRLTNLASGFADHQITIPHGECPMVCIGGHAQTGGFGHLLRGFGLALDYVSAFTIVLADGTVRTVQRPAGQPTTADEELFWGVLGGNAGSFGIVTNYRFECIKNDDHPNSYGYVATRKYEKARYKSLMKEVQVWTQGVEAGTLPPGIDFMMTVESSFAPFLPPIHLVELVHSNLGGPGEIVNGDEVFNSIIQASDAGAGLWLIQTDKGPDSLSALSDSFVRRWPMTTSDGREFKYPYKKRINCTTSALTDVFIDRFVDMVDKVVTNTEGVYLVFQMLIGGGSYKNTSRRAATSIPRRDFVFCFIFDLFYDTGYEEDAVRLQNEMQALVASDFSTAQEQRLFWGSFGDTDITKPSVINFYYDDINKYIILKELKKKVDPDDVFNTSFTVKLP